jgi:hypothetical protein
MRILPLSLILFSLIFVGIFVVSSNARADVFENIRNAIADATDTSFGIAGYFFGFLIILLTCFVVYFFIPDVKLMLFFGLIAIAFCVLMGFWPSWTLLLLIIGFAALLFRFPSLEGGKQ